MLCCRRFTLRLLFLCGVLSPDFTCFDQGCSHHPHVSTTLEKHKRGRETCVMSIACALLCRSALRIRVHFKHLVLFGGAAESEISACWRARVCARVRAGVCFHALWQPLSQFSPSVKTLRAQSSLPPLLLSRGPALTVWQELKVSTKDILTHAPKKHFWCKENGPICRVQITAKCQQSEAGPTGGNNTSQVQMILLRTKRECQPPKALCLSILIRTLFWLLFAYQKGLFFRVLNLRCDSRQMRLGFRKLVFRYPHFIFNSTFLRGFYCLHFLNALKKKNTHAHLTEEDLNRTCSSIITK